MSNRTTSRSLGENAIAALETWFASLGDSYRGRLRSDDVLVVKRKLTAGWRVFSKKLNAELIIGVDSGFPYSAALAFLADHEETSHAPHVERDGKLCLSVRECPDDPIKAVKDTIRDAVQLLDENSSGKHIEDFQEDFGLYWAQSSCKRYAASIYLPCRHAKSLLGSLFRCGERVYIFNTEEFCRRYAQNLFQASRPKIESAAIIRVSSLPAPDRYPASGRELWDYIVAHSADGQEILAGLLDKIPNEAIVVLTGQAPSGREHAAAIRLQRPRLNHGKLVSWPNAKKGIAGSGLSLGEICSRYDAFRVATNRLDAAISRLPYADAENLAKCRIAIIGCGALGSGVATLLAKAGVGRFLLVDSDTVQWENIRRHELGAQHVAQQKAEALAKLIAKNLPDIQEMEARATSLHKLLTTVPGALDKFDIVISCTGSWGADVAIENYLRNLAVGPIRLYGWMESNGVAAHAVLLGEEEQSFRDGFDNGEFVFPASQGGKAPPPECGGSTSPFGPIELSNAQALVARLALDALRGKAEAPVWRTWLTDEAALAETGALWSEKWVAERGEPPKWGGIFESSWAFTT